MYFYYQMCNIYIYDQLIHNTILTTAVVYEQGPYATDYSLGVGLD